MRNFMFLAGGLAGVCMTAFAAHSADEQGQYFVKGIGSLTCEQYLMEMANGSPTHVMFRSWLNGYLTAYNTFVAQTYDIAPGSNVEGLANVMETICRNSPDAMFAAASQGLTNALIPQRQVAMATATVPSAAAPSGEMSIFDVQTALQQRGYFSGTVDGLLGPATGAALEAYQRENGLTVTGIPDAETRQALSR